MLLGRPGIHLVAGHVAAGRRAHGGHDGHGAGAADCGARRLRGHRGGSLVVLGRHRARGLGPHGPRRAEAALGHDETAGRACARFGNSIVRCAVSWHSALPWCDSTYFGAAAQVGGCALGPL